MCGIFGYLGLQRADSVVLEGLQKLEYRGYDSVGIAAWTPEGLIVEKAVGRVEVLNKRLQSQPMYSSLAIGHTRWATHGVASEENAHPHVDQHHMCAIVHNGIIENFKEIKQWLEASGVQFSSDTDSEVIAQLFAFRYQQSGDLVRSFSWTLSQLEGSFACALIHRDHPETLLCASQESSLVIGVGDNEIFLSSDVRAFSKYARKVQSLSSGELAVINKHGLNIYNFELQKVQKDVRQITYSDDHEYDKQGYSYYMLKEIYEQPDVFAFLLSKYIEEDGSLSSCFLPDLVLSDFDRIFIVACGSSYHAGFLAKYIIESLVPIPVHVEIASEFRYRQGFIGNNTLVVLISQSGETADTLAALKEFRHKGATCILGICNVAESALSISVDHCLFLEAGIEIGVASTKAFTAQLLLLNLLALKLAEQKQSVSKAELQKYGNELSKLPDLSKLLLENPSLHVWGQAHAEDEHFIFLGRRWMYPICMEGALKLKEIAYVEANAYAAGEMKHGPIALISRSVSVVAFCGDSVVYDKMIGSIMEVKARHARVTVLAPSSRSDVSMVSDEQIFIPDAHPLLEPILYTIAAQVMAYHVAFFKGTEIDTPRNLAKSVTVE